MADQFESFVRGADLDQSSDGVQLVGVFVRLATQAVSILLDAGQLAADLVEFVLAPKTRNDTGDAIALFQWEAVDHQVAVLQPNFLVELGGARLQDVYDVAVG